jgi:hypothetical protein
MIVSTSEGGWVKRHPPYGACLCEMAKGGRNDQ